MDSEGMLVGEEVSRCVGGAAEVDVASVGWQCESK